MSLTILGLPLTPESVTPEFLEFIDQPNVILIQATLMYSVLEHNNDYVTARVGYDLLFEKNFKLTEILPVDQTHGRTVYMKQLWTRERDTGAVAEQLIAYYQELRAKNPDSVIATVTPGSPRLYDAVSANLIASGVVGAIVDTPSSAEIAVDYLKKNRLIPDLDVNILSTRNVLDIRSDRINVLGCLGKVYNVNITTLISQLVANITGTATIYKISLSDTVRQIKLSKIDLIRELLSNQRSFNSTIVVIAN
jgi:hypothetical protein